MSEHVLSRRPCRCGGAACLQDRRWVAAEFLNERAGWCWARLCGWVDGTGAESLEDCRQDFVCEGDATRNGWCYCGKVTRPHLLADNPPINTDGRNHE